MLRRIIYYLPRAPVALSSRSMRPRPAGSWLTSMRVDDRAGFWLNFQFDPYERDFEDFYGGYERFKPENADWDWA